MLRSLLASAFGAVALLALPFLAACAQPPPPPLPASSTALAPNPAELPQRATSNRAVTLRFAPGASDLNAAGRASLSPLLDRLLADPRSVVTITSHAELTDITTARARAAAVRRTLTERGIPARRIRMVNAGMTAGADPEVVMVQVR